MHKIQIILCCLLTLIPTTAFSLEYQPGIFLDEQLILENNYFTSTSGEFNQSDPVNLIVISPNIYVSAGNQLSIYMLTDLYWAHYLDSLEDDELDAEFINAYVTLFHKKLTSDIGIQSFTLGKGHIMASNEPGITVHYQSTSKLSCTIEAARVINTSPIISTTIDYQTGFSENLSLFGVWFQDNDNGFADMLNYQDQALMNSWLYARNPTLWLLNQADLLNFTKSQGDLFWYGISSDIFLGDFYLSGIMMIETGNGSISLEYPDRVWEFTLSSYLVDVDLNYNFTDSFSAGMFIFIIGGMNNREKDIHAFIAPMPRHDRTSIFLSQRFSDQIEDDFLSKGAIYWAGVIAPGIKIDYHRTEKLRSSVTLAVFFPEDTPADNRSWYGWETDTTLSYTIQEKYTLSCEFGLFQHGDFYQYQGKTPEPATKFTMGIHTFF